MPSCACGCGTPVKRRYVHGHNPSGGWNKGVSKRLSELRELVEKATPATCQIVEWSLLPSGYATVGWKGRVAKAHRVTWELVYGPVSDGVDLHHTCGARNCVNWLHLEPMDHAEHTSHHRRQNA